MTYNAEPVFKTGLGGCITITLLIYFIGNFLLNVVAVLFRNQFTVSQYDEFNSYLTRSEPEVMSTQNQTIFSAINLDNSFIDVSLPSGYSSSDLFRI